MLKLQDRLKRRERGDTIVEVLVVMAVLGLAFSIAYATANRSLIMARNAQEHGVALQYINSQVELLRADASDSALYAQTVPFCMDATTGKPVVGPVFCTIGASTSNPYNVGIVYAKTTTGFNVATGKPIDQDVFTVGVTWQGVSSLGPQQEHLRYKLHLL